MRDALVPLATFDTHEEADLLRRQLLAVGVPVIVSGDKVIGFGHAVIGPAFGAIRILVAEAHRDRALEILSKAESPEPEETTQGDSQENRPSEELANLAMADLATVDAIHAHFLVQELQAMGINASVYDEINESFYPWTGARVGKVRIVVLERDLERALEVLHRPDHRATKQVLPSTQFRATTDRLRSAPSEPKALARNTAIQEDTRPSILAPQIEQKQPILDIRLNGAQDWNSGVLVCLLGLGALAGAILALSAIFGLP